MSEPLHSKCLENTPIRTAMCNGRHLSAQPPMPPDIPMSLVCQSLSLEALYKLVRCSKQQCSHVEKELRRRFNLSVVQPLCVDDPMPRRGSVDDRELVVVLRSCEKLGAPLHEQVASAWSSHVSISDQQVTASDTFQLVSGPLSEIARRVYLLPAPSMGTDALPDVFFSFGIWTVWLSGIHGFLAVDNSSGNMMFASQDGDQESGMIIYNADMDSEVLVNDSGVLNSTYNDSNGFFQMLCKGGHCDCGGRMLHDSTCPWQVAVVHHRIASTEVDNHEAAILLQKFMRDADSLSEDFNCAWKCDSDEGHTWWHIISDIALDSLFLVCIQSVDWIQVWHLQKYRSKVALYSSNSSFLAGLTVKCGRHPLIDLGYSSHDEVYC